MEGGRTKRKIVKRAQLGRRTVIGACEVGKGRCTGEGKGKREDGYRRDGGEADEAGEDKEEKE